MAADNVACPSRCPPPPPLPPAPHRRAVANKSASWVVANWTLGQALASKPGQQYSYSDDAYALLSHIIERVGPWGSRLLPPTAVCLLVL